MTRSRTRQSAKAAGRRFERAIADALAGSDAVMRMCSRSGLSARARAYWRGEDEPLVHLRMGGMYYMLDAVEARQLAPQLVINRVIGDE
jgi:hypothetical protein